MGDPGHRGDHLRHRDALVRERAQLPVPEAAAVEAGLERDEGFEDRRIVGKTAGPILAISTSETFKACSPGTGGRPEPSSNSKIQ